MTHTRFEHLALNVTDMDAMAEWYCSHLAMTIARSDPGKKLFLADAAGVVVFELYSNEDQPKIDLSQTSSAALHIAFVVDEMQPVLAALTAAGATIETPPTDADGDTLVMLRDPFGLALQLVERNTPILK